MANNKIDKTPPKLSKSSPTANKQSVELDSDISFTFNEKIKAGIGNIVITDGSDTRSIPITDAQVKISDKTITINPTVDFFPNSNYVIKISSTAIQDLTGNPYKETKAPLSFMTKNAIAPVDTKPTTSTDTLLAPVFASATVNGNAFVMTLKNDGLLSTDSALPNAFSVIANGVVNPVTDVFINPTAKTVALHLTNFVPNGQAVTVAYTDPTNGNDVNALQDVAGNDVTSFSAQIVKNNTLSSTTTAPTTPVTITPTEPKFVFSSDTQSVDEGKSVTVTVTSDIAAPVLAYNVPYKLDGTAAVVGKGDDYIDYGNGTIYIPAGQKTGSLTLSIIADNKKEGVETITVSSTSGVNSNAVSVNINDTSFQQNISVNSSGISDVSKIDALFNITQGSYTYTITGFNNDTIKFPHGQTPTISNENLTDGKVDLQYALDGQIATITLTGLENDAMLYSIDSFKTAFGADSII